MRYFAMLFVAALLAAPIIGCESHTEEKTTRNPLTGSETHTTDKSMNGN